MVTLSKVPKRGGNGEGRRGGGRSQDTMTKGRSNGQGPNESVLGQSVAKGKQRERDLVLPPIGLGEASNATW